MHYQTIALTSFSQVLTCLLMSLQKLRSRVRFINMLWLQHFRLMASGIFKDWNALFFFVKLPKTENMLRSLNFV